ncbi:hypothetical protein BH11VER1_BH11VER1_21420 [soil metagenome]
MNDEEFEKKLHALTGALERPDPTAVWKADILARARREAEPAASRRLLPPRWLMATWGAAWIAMAWMSFTTPQSAEPGHHSNLSTLPESPISKPASEMNASPQTLIAYQRNFLIDNP